MEERAKRLTERQNAINELVEIKQRINKTRTRITTIQRLGGQALEYKGTYRALRKRHIEIREKYSIKSSEIRRQK